MPSDVEKLLQQIRSLPPAEQRRLREALNQEESPKADVGEPDAEEDFQRRLVEAGLLDGINRPRRDAQAFHNRPPVELGGKPLSETIIEERRYVVAPLLAARW